MIKRSKLIKMKLKRSLKKEELKHLFYILEHQIYLLMPLSPDKKTANSIVSVVERSGFKT